MAVVAVGLVLRVVGKWLLWVAGYDLFLLFL